jgi:hypothetical protein
MQGASPSADGRALQADSFSGRAIRNPVVCAGAGSAILWSDLSAEHYPMYQKNSLLNSNDQFDFGAFVRLGEELKADDGEDEAPSSFLFVFAEAGIYVFRDSGSAAKETIVAVMGGGAACPSSLMYEAKTYSALLQVGASMRDDVSLSPDWSLFVASCIGFGVVIVLTALTVSYTYNKNWDQDPARKSVRYQMRQYTKLARSDIEDKKALVSINSEASAFQFRRQTAGDASGAPQGAAGGAGPLPTQRGKQARALDLEELEKLKSGLDQQVRDMRKIYSKDDHLDLSDDEDDPDVHGAITYLKRLIESNKSILAGEGGDNSDIGSAESDEESDGEERRAKEREEKEQKEKEFNRIQADAERATGERAAQLRDAASTTALEDFAEKAEQLKDKLRRQGTGAEVDAGKLLADIGTSCEEMGRVLEGDKARQQELLRKRQEARRRRRAKLQGDLGNLQEQVAEREKDYAKAQDDVASKHTKEYDGKCAEYEREHAEAEAALGQRLRDEKQDKLSAYEDKLKEAKKSNDFAAVLDEYQGAQSRVEKELEKQRAKEMSDLQRRLKNRRNKAQSEKELATQAELKALAAQEGEKIERMKQEEAQLVSLIAAQEASAAAGTQTDNDGDTKPRVKDMSTAAVSPEETEQIARAKKEAEELEKQQARELRAQRAKASKEEEKLAKEAQEAGEAAKASALHIA